MWYVKSRENWKWRRVKTVITLQGLSPKLYVVAPNFSSTTKEKGTQGFLSCSRLPGLKVRSPCSHISLKVQPCLGPESADLRSNLQYTGFIWGSQPRLSAPWSPALAPPPIMYAEPTHKPTANPVYIRVTDRLSHIQDAGATPHGAGGPGPGRWPEWRIALNTQRAVTSTHERLHGHAQ